jgi:hypothetical protein
MRRNAIVTAAVVIAVLALGSQIAIPAYVSSEVEDRLTEGGGTAHVEVHAIPALELIGGNGDRIEVRASDLRFDLPDGKQDVFDRLDGFDEVEARLTRVTTGPFRVERFELRRGAGEGTYRMVMRATATPDELTDYAAERLGAPFNGFMGRFATGLLPWDDNPVAINLDARVRSDDGRPTVVSATGDIAGLPVNPVAERLVGAVAKRL